MKENLDTDTCWYHYCSLEVFQSIINNKELWLSEARTTNDSTELIWFADNIKPILINQFAKQSNSFKGKYNAVFDLIVDKTYEEFFSEISYYHMFILCLSKTGDLLSQWRGYTPNGGNGISIGFDKEKVVELLQYQNSLPPIIEPGMIDYDNKQKSQKFILDVIENYLFPELNKIDDTDKNNFVTKSMAAFEKRFKIMFQNAVLVKSNFFSEEREVRLYLWETLDFKGSNAPKCFDLSPIQYRSKDNLIIPYIKMNFSKHCDISNLIKEVVIGPKCQATTGFVSSILKSNGFSNAKARKSDGFGIYR